MPKILLPIVQIDKKRMLLKASRSVESLRERLDTFSPQLLVTLLGIHGPKYTGKALTGMGIPPTKAGTVVEIEASRDQGVMVTARVTNPAERQKVLRDAYRALLLSCEYLDFSSIEIKNVFLSDSDFYSAQEMATAEAEEGMSKNDIHRVHVSPAQFLYSAVLQHKIHLDHRTDMKRFVG
jgi:hypothetical protein